MAAVGAAAMAATGGAVADIVMTNAASTIVDAANAAAKMDQKGRRAALDLI